MIPFLLKYWKYAAGAALLCLLWLVWHQHGVRRYEAGRAAVEALWHAADVAAQKVADDARRAAELADAADESRNQEIARDHAQELAAITGDRDRLVRLLRNARTAAGSGPAPEGPDQSGAAPAGPQGGAGTTDAAAGIDRAIADVIAEARANASQLDALIAEIRPQM